MAFDDINDHFDASFASAPLGPKDFEGQWGHPDLSYVGTGRRLAPGFPSGTLGPWDEWVRGSAENASAPIDYTAVSLIACAAAALGNVRWPVTSTGWSEPPALWIAQVGGPGAGKSPGSEPSFDLVRHVEDAMAADHEDAVRAYSTAKEVSKLVRADWEGEIKTARKNGISPPDQPAGAIEPTAPVRPRIRVADATVEALGLLAANLPRGLLLVRDELSGWLGAFDKYGGGGSDRAFALEMFGGRSYVVDRVKSPEPLHIRRLTVGVLGGIQPDKIGSVIAGPDDGLVPRILWAWPEHIPEFRLGRVVVDHGPAKAAFMRLASLLMASDLYGNPEPKRVRLQPAAERVLEEFARDVGGQAQEASGVYAGSLIKARGHALRLATVLEFLWWSWHGRATEPEVVTEAAVTHAVGLVDGYFLPMAERVFGDAAIPTNERAARHLARYLQRKKVQRFNARAVGREIGGILRNAADMDAAIMTLTEGNLVQPDTASVAAGRVGRKAKDFLVHPAVWRVT